jgi:hypothetical protein
VKAHLQLSNTTVNNERYLAERVRWCFLRGIGAYRVVDYTYLLYAHTPKPELAAINQAYQSIGLAKRRRV